MPPMHFAPTANPGAPIAATYADDRERYLVSLVVSYSADDAGSPAEAIELAVSLITDAGSADTLWCVLDRVTGTRHIIEQGDALAEWPSGDVVRRDTGGTSDESQRYYRVVLSEQQLAVADTALTELRAGDDDAHAENLAALAALRNAEPVR